MENDIKAFAIYSRKSKFTGKGESVENQAELCRQYIRAHYSQINESGISVYEDEGFSGENIERPQFKRMMADVRKKKFGAVICYRLDRISRNIGDFAKLIEELNGLDVSFISIKEQFDTSSPMGRAMMYIASVFSQLERETIAERIRDNMQELAKTGRWLGGTTPTGYASQAVQKITLDGRVRKAYKLSLIDQEARTVRRIFDKFLETNSLTGTETYLIQNAYLSKNGKSFSRFTIKNILENPVYMIADADAYRFLTEQGLDLFSDESAFDSVHGIMAYNKTVQQRGKTNRTRDLKEWIIAVGRHRGIISGADWIRVQALLEQNRSKAYHKPRSNTALLSGLLFCGKCGAYMRPKLTGRQNTDGERIYNYLCQVKEKSRCQCCNIKSPNGNTLDSLVCGAVQRLSADTRLFVRLLDEAEKCAAGGCTDNDGQLDSLQKAYAENEKEITALLRALAQAGGTPAQTYIMEQIGGLHEKNEAVQRRIKEMERLADQRVLPDSTFEALGSALSAFGRAFDGMQTEQKRVALRAFIDRVVWDGEDVHIYFYGAENGPLG